MARARSDWCPSQSLSFAVGFSDYAAPLGEPIEDHVVASGEGVPDVSERLLLVPPVTGCGEGLEDTVRVHVRS